MRKIITIAVSTLLLLSLCACNGTQAEPKAEDEISAVLQSLSTESRAEDAIRIDWDEGGSQDPLIPPVDRLAMAADAVTADDPELQPAQNGQIIISLEDGAVLHLIALEPLGKIRLRYEQDGSTQIAMMESLELYTWMIAVEDCPAAQMADVDGDGFWESLFWAPQLCIFDCYGDQVHSNEYVDENSGDQSIVRFVHQTSVGKHLDEEYQNMLVIRHHGKNKVFSYLDGELTFICTYEDLQHRISE